LKLIKDGWNVFVGKYDDLEIDFVCFKDTDTKYIQVTLSMPQNSTRETDNLLVVKDNYERLIITYDYKDVGIIDGIKIVHLSTFLAEYIAAIFRIIIFTQNIYFYKLNALLKCD